MLIIANTLKNGNVQILMVITSCSIFWRLLYTRFIKWYFKAAQRKLTQDIEGTLGEITNLFCLFSSTLCMICLVISLPPLFLCSNWVDAFFPSGRHPSRPFSSIHVPWKILEGRHPFLPEGLWWVVARSRFAAANQRGFACLLWAWSSDLRTTWTEDVVLVKSNRQLIS